MSNINLSYWFLQTVAMALTFGLIPNLRVTHFLGATLMVVALALVNTHLWDAALFFEIPDHFSWRVAGLLLANGLIFWVIAKLLPGIEVEGILPALVAPLVFTGCSLLINRYGSHIDWNGLGATIAGYFAEVKNYFLEGGEIESPEKVEEGKEALILFHNIYGRWTT